jgi:hypothetical protein
MSPAQCLLGTTSVPAECVHVICNLQRTCTNATGLEGVLRTKYLLKLEFIDLVHNGFTGLMPTSQRKEINPLFS